MSESLYITSTESRSGKSLIALGLMELLLRKVERVAFFRPIIFEEKDNDIDLISSHFQLGIPHEQMYALTSAEVSELLAHGRQEEIIERVIDAYRKLADRCGFVLCEGTDFVSSTAAFELDINADIANNLGSSVLLVGSAHEKSLEETLRNINIALESLNDKGCHTVATIVNRVDPEDQAGAIDLLRRERSLGNQLIYAIPEVESLSKPTVREIARNLDARIIYGHNQLHRHVYNFTVAAMQLQNFLPRIEHGSLIITPGDRADVIIGSLSAASSQTMETISGILLTGGLKPEPPVWKLIEGFKPLVAILSVKDNTFPTAAKVDKIHAVISPDDERKIVQAIATFEKHVDVDELAERIIKVRPRVVTPKMFEYELIQRAKKKKQRIVLPEGEEERILRASEALLRREVVEIILLGNPEAINGKITELGLRIGPVEIIEPVNHPGFEDFALTYYELRKHKGITLDNAHDVMSDVNYFGTMMVYKRIADGMVSGAIHSTASTIRPALEIIKTKPGVKLVSSVFFMCLKDRVLVYGDCAVNPDPDAEQLADIALTSARTAKDFGIEPIVAMLSYSTGESGKGADVEKVKLATQIAREKAKKVFPGLKIDGPLQYDAAVDPVVARTKMPNSEVAGRATVLIFPDLNTGNNTYKAVQRSAGAVAIGPVLQGLKYPVNDLSRGCTVADVINTVAITAIQAQKTGSQ